MKSVKLFNNLHNETVSREHLQNIYEIATREEQPHIAHKIKGILDKYPEGERFEFSLNEKETETLPTSFLAGIYIDDIEEEEPLGLGKAITPEEIYKMITHQMIDLIKKASTNDYKKAWKDNVNNGFLIPINYETKKPYKGINQIILKNAHAESFFEPMKNPYFLTFKQIQKHKGKLKKGAKGNTAVYYSVIYKVASNIKNGNKYFQDRSREKAEAFCKMHDIPVEKITKYFLLKYYNVFNGEDIEGIDFQLEKLELGRIKPEDGENKTAEAIVKCYPTPAPKLIFGGNRAFYDTAKDRIHIPVMDAFTSENDFFRTLFHEITHSTGHKKRLNRFYTIIDREVSLDDYFAFEELVAEFGSVFLSAQAGIIWYNNKNHASYIKGWKERIKKLEEDEKLLMRAAAYAQKATDFVLNLDKNGEPAFYKELLKPEVKEEPKEEPKKRVQSEDYTPALNAPVIYTERFKKMKVSELRQYTLNYYNTYLKGDKALIKKHLKEVIFTTKAGRKIAKGEAMYSAKAAVIEHLKELIENSTYNNWGDRKKTDSKDVIGYLNFKSKLTIDGEKRHIRISLTVYKDRSTQLKNIEVGKKKASRLPQAPVAFLQDGEVQKPFKDKNKTKNEKTKKKENFFSLGVPLIEKVEQEPTRPLNVFDKMNRIENAHFEYFNIEGDVSEFLGNLEKKRRDSLVITIGGAAGSGKTRFAFQFINALAQNYKVGHASIEEHPESKLYFDKVRQYLNDTAMKNTQAPEINTLEDLQKLITDNDVIIIDSFEKLREIDPNFQLDKDLRKKYDGKLFLIVYQLTVNNKMRGGAKSEFDGDIILQVKTFADYRENYVYPTKNRYNEKPAHLLMYNIHNKALITENNNTFDVYI